MARLGSLLVSSILYLFCNAQGYRGKSCKITSNTGQNFTILSGQQITYHECLDTYFQDHLNYSTCIDGTIVPKPHYNCITLTNLDLMVESIGNVNGFHGEWSHHNPVLVNHQSHTKTFMKRRSRRSPNTGKFTSLKRQELEQAKIKKGLLVTAIDPNTPGIVRIHPGDKAFLLCRVENLGTNSLIWSYGKRVISIDTTLVSIDPDRRFKPSYDEATGTWLLEIRDIRSTDEGSYECRVSTRQPLTHYVSLQVIPLGEPLIPSTDWIRENNFEPKEFEDLKSNVSLLWKKVVQLEQLVLNEKRPDQINRDDLSEAQKLSRQPKSIAKALDQQEKVVKSVDRSPHQLVKARLEKKTQNTGKTDEDGDNKSSKREKNERLEGRRVAYCALNPDKTVGQPSGIVRVLNDGKKSPVFFDVIISLPDLPQQTIEEFVYILSVVDYEDSSSGCGAAGEVLEFKGRPLTIPFSDQRYKGYMGEKSVGHGRSVKRFVIRDENGVFDDFDRIINQSIMVQKLLKNDNKVDEDAVCCRIEME